MSVFRWSGVGLTIQYVATHRQTEVQGLERCWHVQFIHGSFIVGIRLSWLPWGWSPWTLSFALVHTDPLNPYTYWVRCMEVSWNTGAIPLSLCIILVPAFAMGWLGGACLRT